MSVTAPRQNARLRSACDGCSAAKVKCDKKHPACDRCVNNQLECIYSASRRNGKPSLQQRMANGRARALAAKPTRIASPTQGGIGTGTSMLVSDGQIWDSVDYCPTSMNGGIQTSGQDEMSNATNGFIDPIQLWPQESFPMDFQLDELGTSALQSNSPTLPSPQPDSNPNPSPNKATATTTAKNIHDCEASAVAILRSLQLDAHLTTHLNQDQSITPATPESWARAGLDLSPSFDRVIAAIKRALDIWQELMRCACVQCPHMSLLLVSILWKFVFWYRVMAAGSCPLSGADDCVRRIRSDGGNGDEGADGVEGKEAPPAMIDEFRVRPTRVEVGELDLDQEEQTGLRRVILLRELRRAGKVIGEMTSVNRTPSGEADGEFRAKWTALGVERIQDELRETIQKFEQ